MPGGDFTDYSIEEWSVRDRILNFIEENQRVDSEAKQ
jgi:hypothetical protein